MRETVCSIFRCGEYRYSDSGDIFRDGTRSYYEHSANASAIWVSGNLKGLFEGNLKKTFEDETQNISKIPSIEEGRFGPETYQVEEVLSKRMQSDMPPEAHYKLDGYRVSGTSIVIHLSPPEWVGLLNVLMDAQLFEMEFKPMLRKTGKFLALVGISSVGLIVIGSARGVAKGLQDGLHERIERAIIRDGKEKVEPESDAEEE